MKWPPQITGSPVKRVIDTGAPDDVPGRLGGGVQLRLKSDTSTMREVVRVVLPV